MPEPGSRPVPTRTLAADHRNGFKVVLGVHDREFNPREVRLAKHVKDAIIGEGFRRAVKTGAFAEGDAGLLMDQRYGSQTIANLLQEGFSVGVPVEESIGQQTFALEFPGRTGEVPDFQTQITQYEQDGHPLAFVKALINYNPDQPQDERNTLYDKLREVITFANEHHYPFVLEPIIKPTKKQQEDQSRDFETQIRPELAVRMIADFKEAGLPVDVWKIQAFDDPQHFRNVLIEAAKAQNGDKVKVVLLGRDAEKEVVDQWLRVAAQSTVNIDGQNHEVAGYYIGRTIFKGPIERYEMATRQDEVRRNRRGLMHPIESALAFFIQRKWLGIEKRAASRAADEVAANYLHFNSTFDAARQEFSDAVVPQVTLKPQGPDTAASQAGDTSVSPRDIPVTTQ